MMVVEVMDMRLLTAKEVAELLRVPVPRVYALGRLRVLPVVRVGRQVRFDADRLAKWIRDGGHAYTEAG